MKTEKNLAMFYCEESPNDSLQINVLSDKSIVFDMFIDGKEEETVVLSAADSAKLRDFLIKKLG